jgi:hypothetical protein
MLIKKIYKKIFLLEKGKFMAPKYTSCFTDLIDSLAIDINYDTMSQCSSMMSQTFSLRKESLDDGGDQLRSNTLLSNKRNLLEVKANKIFNSSMSLHKDEFMHAVENEEESTPMFAPRSTSLTPMENQLQSMKSNKFKLNELRNLKDLRGTLNMPRVEQFLPRKEELEAAPLPPRRNTFLEPQRAPESPNPPAKMVFRRQKYSRAEVKAEDL